MCGSAVAKTALRKLIVSTHSENYPTFSPSNLLHYSEKYTEPSFLVV